MRRISTSTKFSPVEMQPLTRTTRTKSKKTMMVIHTYIHTYIHTLHIHTVTHTYIHTYIHTYTQ